MLLELCYIPLLSGLVEFVVFYSTAGRPPGLSHTNAIDTILADSALEVSHCRRARGGTSYHLPRSGTVHNGCYRFERSCSPIRPRSWCHCT